MVSYYIAMTGELSFTSKSTHAQRYSFEQQVSSGRVLNSGVAARIGLIQNPDSRQRLLCFLDFVHVYWSEIDLARPLAARLISAFNLCRPTALTDVDANIIRL